MKKKKKERKHLCFYLDHIKSGVIPSWGLCSCSLYGYLDDRLLDLFTPSSDDLGQLIKEGSATCYWGSGTNTDMLCKFTTLRQTIVLFMAAINNEL